MALRCVSCDTPAPHKACGFLGHNSRLGCNKCYKQFIVNISDSIVYSGFDRNS